MIPKKILLADNDPVFLDICTEFLESAGYLVVKATNPSEARQVLEQQHIHLAILDLRLTDDSERDRSGLLVAAKIARSIPKIILTKFPTHEDVRDAMRWDGEKLPPAIDFVDKRKGLKDLLEAVTQAFANHICRNWDLTIDWGDREPFGLVRFMMPDLGGSRLINFVEEFKDLFRCIFLQQRHIRFDRVLWQRSDRIALIVHGFKDVGGPEAFMVVCGSIEGINQETHKFKSHAPKASSTTATSLHASAETTHFAANIYVLANSDLVKVSSLQELYRLGPEKRIKNAITALFEKTLSEWHQGKRVVTHEKKFPDLYRDRLHLTQPGVSPAEFDTRVQWILHQLPALGINIQQEKGRLTLKLNWETKVLPDPISFLFRESSTNQPVVLMTTPGSLSGQNILTSPEGEHAWLTDFAEAGLAPSVWNFTELEATVRFDWADTTEPQRIIELENCLAISPFAHPDLNLVEGTVKKPLRAIQAIRQHAIPLTDQEVTLYHLGIYFQAASRIAAFDLDYPCLEPDLTRLFHLLLAMAVLCEQITQDLQPGSELPSPQEHLSINEQGVVRVRGGRLSIRGQGRRLLQYLYDRQGQVCTREEIARHVFDIEDYQNLPMDLQKSEENRINAAIRRLREKIEINPSEPRYLLNEPGVGYRLVQSPQS